MTSSFTVCILAYNEEKRIAATTAAILAGARDPFPVRLYPNGCTDRTVAICRELAAKHSNVEMRELAQASKPNAWNTAFAEHADAEFLVFADGDILPDPGAAEALVKELVANPDTVIASCRQVPILRGRGWQHALAGVLLTPLNQDFLAGGFYAVRRQALAGLLAKQGLQALPLGITGEDCLLSHLVGNERVVVSECRSAYQPPNLRDLCRYLARMRWQNEQLAMLFPAKKTATEKTATESGFARFVRKLRASPSKQRFVINLMAAAGKFAFKTLASPIIRENYRKLGPIRADGASILAASTRSSSAK